MEVKIGDIFESKCSVIVNTVNCVGVMGKGIAKEFKKRYPDKSLWIYSGYTYDVDLVPGGRAYFDETSKILSLCDVMVDGEFVQELYDITLRFRGSSNQRIIDVKQSVKEGKTVLWEGDAIFADHSM